MSETVDHHDYLTHDEFAEGLLRNLRLLGPGSVVAIQGPWGRGKTHALSLIEEKASNHNYMHTIRLNPWQYSQDDLLTPLAAKLLEVLGKDKEELAKSQLRTIIAAGISIAGMAGRIFAPGGGDLVFKGADSARRILDQMRIEDYGSASEYADPASHLSQRYKEIVDNIFDDEDQRILICIDDIDRCLPHRLVAMLEVVHFLTMDKPRTDIVVALDPTLCRDAVHTHYGCETFDVDAFLDKLFALCVWLPYLSQDEVRNFLEQRIAHLLGKGRESCLCGIEIKDIVGGIAMMLPESHRTPRVLERVINRIILLNEVGFSFKEDSYMGSLAWILIADLDPGIRIVLQSKSVAETSISHMLQEIHKAPSTPTDPVGRQILRTAMKCHHVDLCSQGIERTERALVKTAQ